MKCPSCKATIPDHFRFCSKCGTSLKGEDQTRTIQGPASMFEEGQIIAGKYRIIKKIGEGGMGVVYKAQDTKLDRPVALKFLPVEMTRDQINKKRFVQEARAAAALNHPNITIVHEIGEDGEQTFIAMEFIEGQTLHEKIESESLEIEEAVGIVSQVAEGLKEAHEKEIIHRDIKPANIMLTKKGRAKIMDFGLAKLSWGADLTKPSMPLGTVAYMSPEQTKGEEVDHKTDIWSLGATLYEMLTGERPFKNDQEHALIHSILNDEPRAPAEIRADIPSRIEELIVKALEKDPQSRYQSIRELIEDLKQSAPITFPKAEKSIIVLPFDDLSPDHDQEYFSDGLTEEVISDLSGIGALRVISRSSAMSFKGTKKTAPEIAKHLNVQYVLEGSVRKAGNKIRITAQLIDAAEDTSLWAEKYTGTMDDVFDIQEKVSRSIVDALRVKLSPEENKRISERTIDNSAAYDCYFRAKQAILRHTGEGFNQAVQLIQTGLDILGENETLNATLGYIYVQAINTGISSDKTFLQKAKDYANRALSMNQDSSLAYTVMGLIHWKRGKIQGAVRELKKALAVDPNSPEALLWLAWIYIFSGKSVIARPLLENLIEIDPLTPLNHLILGNSYFFTGEFEASLQYFYTGYKIDPQNPVCGLAYALALASVNKQKEAFEVIDLIAKELPREVFTEIGLFLKYALQNNRLKALQTVSDNLKSYAKRDEMISIFLARGYALLNEKEEAINWINYGFEWGFINYPFLNEKDPFLENIRGEPRFKKLMQRVKREWENFEA